METLRWDSLPLWAGHTQGVFIKGLHVGIKLIVWLCPASKEAFLNLPHKKPHAYHSAATAIKKALSQDWAYFKPVCSHSLVLSLQPTFLL